MLELVDSANLRFAGVSREGSIPSLDNYILLSIT